jgi:hypothetical protein
VAHSPPTRISSGTNVIRAPTAILPASKRKSLECIQSNRSSWPSADNEYDAICTRFDILVER